MAAITVLLGTTKGAFLLDSDADRRDWQIRGPFCDGWPINHVLGDPATGALWAAGGSNWHGPGIWRSVDGGQNWTLSKDNLAGIETVWSLGRAGDTLYAGSKPAQIFQSTDGGETWQQLPALADFPGREDWNPGAAGLVLHSIVSDPARPENLWIGISAVGAFASEDGGKSWEIRNRRSNHDHATHDHGHDHGKVGICVHNIVLAPGGDGRMYQQNHHGVYRSADAGRTWEEISDGLPSTFGFPISVHPRDPQRLWVFPLNGDSLGRFPPDASAAVWRSSDGGDSWQRCDTGLPTKDCFFTVLRQGMAVDRQPSVGVYFGTNSGSVFASTDEGDSWREIARHLPTVLSVEVMEH